MRFADFILANVEPILAEWDAFARIIWPAALNDLPIEPAAMRDHAEEILRSIAQDMTSHQTGVERSDKSKGHGRVSSTGKIVNRASEQHGSDRVGSGFELEALVAEYRALRASVIRLWRESRPAPDLKDLDDLTRFNESIDQSLTKAVVSYTDQVQKQREALIGSERAAWREAESANSAKDMFLATLSHELRAPLNVIAAWVGIYRGLGFNESNFAEGLDVIERSIKAQVQLVDDVLDVSRVVTGKLRLELCECDLIKTINASIDAVRPAAEAKAITLDVKLDPAASRVTCDALRIQQVVWNLVSNAVKFTGKRGTVGVTLNRDGSDLRIAVSDDGQGISAELLPHVFERFRQADNSTRRQYGGLGLGLSIVKHLVELHGGTVKAQSAGEGHGATFILRLPVKAAFVDATDMEDGSADTDGDGGGSAASSVRRTWLDGLRVLVVDDDADARRALSRLLEGVGAHVITAASAANALEALTNAKDKDEGPDVLVSDVGMPGHDGYDLIREVRRRGHRAEDLPAVALTGFTKSKDAREAELAGFQVHVSKPINVHDLTTVIARLAGRVL